MRFYAHRFRRMHAPDCARVPEPKTMCSLFNRCEGCPYPSHGFICWSGNGKCMREFMKKLDKGAEENNDTSGTEQC